MKNRLVIYISGILSSILLWISSPFIFPHNWFWEKDFCGWNNCIPAEPTKGLIVHIIIGIIFIVFVIAALYEIIKNINKK